MERMAPQVGLESTLKRIFKYMRGQRMAPKATKSTRSCANRAQIERRNYFAPTKAAQSSSALGGKIFPTAQKPKAKAAGRRPPGSFKQNPQEGPACSRTFFVFGDFRRDFHRLSDQCKPGFSATQILWAERVGFDFRRHSQLTVEPTLSDNTQSLC